MNAITADRPMLRLSGEPPLLQIYENWAILCAYMSRQFHNYWLSRHHLMTFKLGASEKPTSGSELLPYC